MIFPGPPGTGRTHLSIALAMQAARRGHRVAFATPTNGCNVGRRTTRREIFGNAVAVAAMVDRLVHHAEIINLKGDSHRLKDCRKEVTSE